MSFPNLVKENTKARYHTFAEGVPVNGDNEFDLGITPFSMVRTDQLIFTVTPLGPSVTAAAYVSYNPVTGKVKINFTQGGVDAARVEALMEHSIEW